MRRALFAALVAGGCAAPGSDLVIPVRNPTAPVASQADVTLERLQGDWRVLSAYPEAAPQRVRIADGSAMLDDAAPVAVSLSGPGRLALGDAEWWVHWLDVDNRTAAIGDPGGGFVWIMDRTADPSPDRLEAARQVLDWYGYDLSRMEAF